MAKSTANKGVVIPSNVWEPYFRPTTRVHDSGFRCFECGYLQMGADRKAAKKVVIAKGVDHISNWLGLFRIDDVEEFDMDLLCDGNIRIFNHSKAVWWQIPGFSDANIVSSGPRPLDKELDALWKKQKGEANGKN